MREGSENEKFFAERESVVACATAITLLPRQENGLGCTVRNADTLVAEKLVVQHLKERLDNDHPGVSKYTMRLRDFTIAARELARDLRLVRCVKVGVRVRGMDIFKELALDLCLLLLLLLEHERGRLRVGAREADGGTRRAHRRAAARELPRGRHRAHRRRRRRRVVRIGRHLHRREPLRLRLLRRLLLRRRLRLLLLLLL